MEAQTNHQSKLVLSWN